MSNAPPKAIQAAGGDVSPKAIQAAMGGVSTSPVVARPALPLVDDPWICGYSKLAEEFARRGVPVTPLTLKRMVAKGHFRKAVPLTGSPDSKGGRRGWRRSTVDRHFIERDQQAAA